MSTLHHVTFAFEASEKGNLLSKIAQGGCMPSEMNVTDNVISMTFVDQRQAEVLLLIASLSDVVAVTGLMVRQTTETESRLSSVLAALKEAGFTQHSLAKTAQISSSYLSKLLNGKAPPTEEGVTKICAGLKKLGPKELVRLADEILAEFE